MTAHPRRDSRKTYASKPRLLLLLVLLVSCYVLLPQLASFHASLKILLHPRPLLVTSAVGVYLLTYFLAATTYKLLAPKRLAYGQTVLVQLASNFVNRIVPAGAGALGVNYLYLRHRRHSAAQAAAVVTVNNLIGILGHLLLLAGLGLLFHASLSTGKLSMNIRDAAIDIAGVVLLVALILTVAEHWRRWLLKALRQLVTQLAAYRSHPWRIGAALLSSLALTVCTVGSLWLCLLAVHAQLPFITVLIVFTIGLSAGIVTPTPGGIGGIEAALTAGLVAYHVPAARALSAVLLYRLITYWLSIALGAIAFLFCQRRKLLSVT